MQFRNQFDFLNFDFRRKLSILLQILLVSFCVFISLEDLVIDKQNLFSNHFDIKINLMKFKCILGNYNLTENIVCLLCCSYDKDNFYYKINYDNNKIYRGFIENKNK